MLLCLPADGYGRYGGDRCFLRPRRHAFSPLLFCRVYAVSAPYARHMMRVAP